MVMCPVHERPDHTRRFIGGKNGLYRLLAYDGEWREGTRCGHGEVEYCDGTRVSGEFVKGHVCGRARVVFRDGKDKWGEYGPNGVRECWLEPPPPPPPSDGGGVAKLGVLADAIGGVMPTWGL